MSRPNDVVFINCPFDEEYRACFEAILFTVTIAGYRPCCALDESDSGDIRFDKLLRLIKDSDRTIHDLSRTEVNLEGLPRFNMPFELGLMMGARNFGGPRQRIKQALIMVREQYVMPRFLSDLAGNDPAVHGGDAKKVVRIVRDHLHKSPEGKLLPGATHFYDLLREFQSDLPALAAQVPFTDEEVHPFHGHRNYREMLNRFAAVVENMSRAAD